MSDDNLFEVFEGDDIFEEEDGELRGGAEGEGSNKTFMIAVGVLGGLLVLAIGFFIVWALVINPNQQRAATEAAEAVVPPTDVIEDVVDLDATATAEAETVVEEPEPTDIPEATATPTPVVGPTSTPGTDDTEGEEDSGTDAAVATEEPRRSPTPTSTPRPTNTPKPTSSTSAETDDRGTSAGVSGQNEELAATGLGEVMLVVAGVLLIGVAFLARRLRSA